MPRPSHKPARRLPTIIALPIPQFNRHNPPLPFSRGGPSTSRDICEADSGDPHKHTIILAIDSLCAVIDLTLSFFAAKPDYASDIIEWLLDLRGTLSVLEEAIVNGCLDDHSISIYTEGPSDLDAVLSDSPELDPDDFSDDCLYRLIFFWLEEIERRGWELFNICIMSVDRIAARNAFLQTAKLHFPI
jgi:hypothetical protein